MVNKLKKLPVDIRKILKDASELAGRSGSRIYLVGGIVRDLLLSRCNFDFDVVVEGNAIDLARRLAGKYNCQFQRHHSFGTATVYFPEAKIDFATARKEYYSKPGILPSIEPSSLRDDLSRRDFTVNAMAVSLNKSGYGEIVDFYGSLRDLKNKQIRILHSDSFLDDPTRILRAVRFEQRFAFKIEKGTFTLMRQAIKRNFLGLVHPHRLRDEIILILKEDNPYKCINRIRKLMGFGFIHPDIKLKKPDLKLISRLTKITKHCEGGLFKRRTLDRGVVFLAAIVFRLPLGKIERILDEFGFKKSRRRIIISIKANLKNIKRLNNKLLPHQIYSILSPLSFESVLFFYAYYSQKIIRKNIDYFLNELVDIRLHVKGSDLAKIGVRPNRLYSKVLKKLLYAKLDRRFDTKKAEIEEARKIFKNISGSCR